MVRSVTSFQQNIYIMKFVLKLFIKKNYAKDSLKIFFIKLNT